MKEKILIVDDEKEIADLIELYLKSEDYTVYKYYTAAGALDYIHGHYQENISLSDVAAHVYLDKYHLVRVFKAATGYTPYEYLLNLRIDKSKPLLLYTAERVEDIARMVGFSNASCFISAFKRREGKTPLKYRSTGG